MESVSRKVSVGRKSNPEHALGRWCLIRESCRKVQRESRTLAYLGTLVFDQRELYLIRESYRRVPEGKPNFNVPWNAGV